MTGIIRADRPAKGWTEIPDPTLRDSRLSYRARGVLARLLSNADGFRMTAEDLARESPDGRHSVLSALKELRECGYLVTSRAQDKKGRFRTETYVFDFPQDTTSIKVQKTGVRSPDVGPPDVGCTNSIKEYQQNNHQESSSTHARAREEAPAPAGGGGSQQRKARRRRASGIVTWDDDDFQEAERIEQQHDANAIKEAVKNLEKQDIEPVPGLIEKELERLARVREAARRAEERRAAAREAPRDLQAVERGRAFIERVRARREGLNQEEMARCAM